MLITPTTLPTISTLTIGSRRSPLAKAQVIEVQKEINLHAPNLTFDCIFTDTAGDKDQQTSLRSLEKTDFFTKEVDTLLLSGACRIAIHSAKDLPDPIPKGLSIVAISHGVDPADALVLKQGKTLASLPANPIIATSSKRREDAVKQLLPNATFTDIRGTIDQRLLKLHIGTADGVVIAEAAIIRLKITHLNRIKLPGSTSPLQGQLAIVARSDDRDMHLLFACLDSRKHCP